MRRCLKLRLRHFLFEKESFLTIFKENLFCGRAKRGVSHLQRSLREILPNGTPTGFDSTDFACDAQIQNMAQVRSVQDDTEDGIVPCLQNLETLWRRTAVACHLCASRRMTISKSVHLPPTSKTLRVFTNFTCHSDADDQCRVFFFLCVRGVVELLSFAQKHAVGSQAGG